MGHIEKQLNIEFGNKTIPIVLGNEFLDQILDQIKNLNYDKLFVVTDENIASIYLDNFKSLYKKSNPLYFIIIQAGELQKNIYNIDYAAQLALANGVSRKSIFVAFGGGVIGNLTGMLSSLLFRGIRFIHIPTTFLAMHDSVTSQKQAINCGNTKNILGLYSAPEVIFCDVSFISTISTTHLNSGIAELIKNALIFGGQYMSDLEPVLSNLSSLTAKDLLRLVELGTQCKIEMLKDDPYEIKHGLVFEYGHTVGHALEILCKGELTHGESVALGMMVAANVSNKMKFLDDVGLLKHYTLISTLQIAYPTVMPSVKDVVTSVRCDNKKGHLSSVNNEFVQMVLLSDIGKVVTSENKPLVNVSIDIIVEAYNNLVESISCAKS